MSFHQPKFVWLNGEIVEWERANVPILTHALHYGSGVFEGIRIYETKLGIAIFRLKEHLKRLYDSAKLYYIEIPYKSEELFQAAIETVSRNEIRCSGYIRPIVFKGPAGIGLDMRAAPTWVAIIALKYERYFEKEGIDVCVSSWRRLGEPAVPSMSKACGHYVNSILARAEANMNGYDEAIMLDARGFVSEGTGENIFIVKNEELHTPALSSSILNGITRDSVITIARDQGFRVNEREIMRSELYIADEAFLTGTAAEIEPIISIDRRKIGDGKIGPVTEVIRREYHRAASGENPKYHGWLTSVYRA